MEDNKINILLVGDNGAAYAFAKKMSQNGKVGQIYMTSASSRDCEFFKKIDIRDDDLNGLLVFVLENDIKLTVPISERALKSDIVSFFQSNGQNIFAGAGNDCKTILNKIHCRKFLYKVHAPVAKFGIYNKIPQIIDYLEHSKLPAVIYAPENDERKSKYICTTIKTARKNLENLFMKGESDLLIEEYVYGHSFTVYFMTDGYCAVPVNITGNYKFQEGLRCGENAGCYCPDYKISTNVLNNVCAVANNILREFEINSSPYMGFLGIECILTDEENFVVKDLKPFLQNHDASAVLNSIDDDILTVMFSCINGFFSDDYEYIKTNDNYSVSVSVYAKYSDKEISGLSEDECFDFVNINTSGDKYYTRKGLDFCITESSSTLSSAKKKLYEQITDIKFEGMEYYKDNFTSKDL